MPTGDGDQPQQPAEDKRDDQPTAQVVEIRPHSAVHTMTTTIRGE